MGDAVRAMERNADAEKAGPENCGKLPLAILGDHRPLLQPVERGELTE